MWHAHDGMGWWMVFSAALWILFFASIFWLALTLARPRRRVDWEGQDEALEIARRRYAAGEISREEFERIRHDLGSPAPT